MRQSLFLLSCLFVDFLFVAFYLYAKKSIHNLHKKDLNNYSEAFIC